LSVQWSCEPLAPILTLIRARLWFLLVLLLATPLIARAEGEAVVSVYSRTFNGYARHIDGNNQPRPETFVFAEGEHGNGVSVGAPIDSVPFRQIAHTIANALEEQNYFPMPVARHVDLLIVVCWGATGTNWERSGGFSNAVVTDPGTAASRIAPYVALTAVQRSHEERVNAAILGYTDTRFARRGTTLYEDIMSEIDEDRFFVVLKAYDFQRILNQQDWRQVWETRFSVRQAGNRFDQVLPAMANYAVHYSGRDIGPLMRHPVPKGHVEVGTPRVAPATPR